VHGIFYSFIPCTLLVIINFFFLLNLYFIRKSSNKITPSSSSSIHKKKKYSINITVIVLTLISVLLTAPAAYVEFTLFDLLQTSCGQVVITLSDCLSFSNHAVNFFILYKTNTIFSNAMNKLVSKGIRTAQLKLKMNF